MVPKADGTWRPCGDYRRLNLVTCPDLYPPPHMEDLSAWLAGMKIFSKLDLRKGYYQVPVAARDVEKTAVITPFGLYEFLRMPFGLRNAGQSFQRFMDEVLAGVPHIFVYLDDILVASETREQHVQDLERVLRRLQQHGLVLNGEKCAFFATSVSYLGHLVSAEGIRPLETRVAAISEFPRPTTRSELQRFLGMTNYYRRFVRGAASILKPLTDATRGPGGRHTPLVWSEEMGRAFSSAKTALARAATLSHPVEGAELSLAVDVSNVHVGGVLQQREAGAWRPLSFFSRKLNPAETRYSTFDRELLACVAAIRHFRFLLEGRTFSIWSDHKPLSYALHRVSDPWTARQQRHLAYVAEYTSKIQHVAGSKNVVADTLSRPPAGAVQSHVSAAVVPPASTGPLNWEGMAAGQTTCRDLAELKLSDKLKLEKILVHGVEVWCDLSTAVLRPVVPEEYRREVFRTIHELAHPGIRATTRAVTSRFVWPGVAADVRDWCRECVACHRAKPGIVENTPVERIAIPQQRFSHVHVDVVGPLPVARDGQRYLLSMIDRSTRWFEMVPLKTATAEVILDAFVLNWVARFGVPMHVTTDRGAVFTSGTWSEWCTSQTVNHITTTALHPQSNGLVERLHRQVKEALRARGAAADWADHLPWVLLGLRAAHKDECGFSTAEVTLGQQLVVPGQLKKPEHVVTPEPRAVPEVIPPTTRTYAEVVAQPHQVDDVPFVYVQRGPTSRTPCGPIFDGPHRVLKRSDKTCVLDLGERSDTISKDRLKPHRGSIEPPLEARRRRGRPSGSGAP